MRLVAEIVYDDDFGKYRGTITAFSGDNEMLMTSHFSRSPQKLQLALNAEVEMIIEHFKRPAPAVAWTKEWEVEGA